MVVQFEAKFEGFNVGYSQIERRNIHLAAKQCKPKLSSVVLYCSTTSFFRPSCPWPLRLRNLHIGEEDEEAAGLSRWPLRIGPRQ